MSFEIKNIADPLGLEHEVAEETITKTVTTKKFWSKQQLHDELGKLQAEITERQERVTVLVTQVDKFTKEITK